MRKDGLYRPTRFGPVAVTKTVRADGAILLAAPHALEPYPARLSERLYHWADVAPERIFLAQRGADGTWQTLSYAQTLGAVRSLAQALLGQRLSTERTLVILSENSLDHALLALAAIHVGIPYAPISPLFAAFTGFR
ncbi:MAG: AMP-binding protein [Caldilineaceae bacterium]